MKEEKEKFINDEDYSLAHEIEEIMSPYGLNQTSHKQDDPFIVDMIEFIKKKIKESI